MIRIRFILRTTLLLAALAVPAGPQDMMTPGVEVSDQVSLDDTVWVNSAYSEVPCFIVIHADTGEVGVYEFGTMEGADGPVMVDGNVLTFPINAAPSIVYEGSLDADSVTVLSLLIDALLDPTAAGDMVFPMLPYDTGEAGVYEFGTMDGADGTAASGDTSTSMENGSFHSGRGRA